MLSPLKRGAKKIRPLFIPFLRLFIRYVPHETSKRYLWKGLVMPFFQFAKYNFIAKTTFDSIIAGNTEDQIQRFIYYFGFWEPDLTEFIKEKLKPGDTFIDVGANIGYFSLLASKFVGKSGRVLAIEASPKIYALLTRNIANNNATNVTLLNIAASDKEETLRVYLAPNSNIGQTTTLPTEDYSYECDIPAKPLSKIIRRQDFSQVRLIKIDVEGAEWSVVSGLSPLLNSARDDLEIIVEISPERLKAQEKNVEDILDIFTKCGFYPYKLKNDYTALNYISRKPLKRPERITSPIMTHTDVIFSKTDAKTL